MVCRVAVSAWPLILMVCPGEYMYFVSTPNAMLLVTKYSTPVPTEAADGVADGLHRHVGPGGLAIVELGVDDADTDRAVRHHAPARERVAQAGLRDEPVHGILPDRPEPPHVQGNLVSLGAEFDADVSPEIQPRREPEDLGQLAPDSGGDRRGLDSRSNRGVGGDRHPEAEAEIERVGTGSRASASIAGRSSG